MSRVTSKVQSSTNCCLFFPSSFPSSSRATAPAQLCEPLRTELGFCAVSHIAESCVISVWDMVNSFSFGGRAVWVSSSYFRFSQRAQGLGQFCDSYLCQILWSLDVRKGWNGVKEKCQHVLQLSFYNYLLFTVESAPCVYGQRFQNVWITITLI